MRKLCFLLLFSSVSIILKAQDDRVRSVHSVKALFLGVSYSYEPALCKQTTLNLEFILAGGLGRNVIYGDYWLIAPIVRAEPRYYYNFLKRTANGKNTTNNAADYLSLSVDYQLGTSIGNNARALQAISIVPKWGFKRTIGKHFITEFAAGIGMYSSEVDTWQPTIGIDLKFGYSF